MLVTHINVSHIETFRVNFRAQALKTCYSIPKHTHTMKEKTGKAELAKGYFMKHNALLPHPLHVHTTIIFKP